jgi:hypothetical protein
VRGGSGPDGTGAATGSRTPPAGLLGGGLLGAGLLGAGVVGAGTVVAGSVVVGAAAGGRVVPVQEQRRHHRHDQQERDGQRHPAQHRGPFAQ